MKKKHFLIVVVATVAFSLGYGAVTAAWPIKDRYPWRGYFTNTLDYYGDQVWRPGTGPSSCRGSSSLAIPTWVNTRTEFIDFVKCKLNYGNSQERTGAQFIIQTMRGKNNSRPTSSHIADWERRVRNPDISITWNTTRSYTINSYYQGCCGGGSDPNDDAFFEDSGSGSSIVFHIPGPDYVIRRICANPVGNGDVSTLPPGPDFNMSGRSTVNDTTAIPGQVLTFRHYLRNAGPTSTGGFDIDWRIRNTISGNVALTGTSGPFDPDNVYELVRRHTVAVPDDARPGDEICRRIEWNPDREVGGSGVSTPACSTVLANQNLSPSIGVRINGGASPGNFAEPGDSLSFTYTVINSGSGYGFDTDCTIYGQNRTGYYSVPSPIDQSSDPGFSEPPHGCPRDFPPGTTTLVTETIPSGDIVANRSICRSLVVDPATRSGSSSGTQVCAYITAKPYARTFGGDISVGGGLETAPGVCSLNSGAAVIGWNQRSSGGWSGAGVQFAAYAMHTIFDTATSLGSGSGSAPRPDGLSFANTGVGGSSSSGRFGGHFGSVACVPDYYATLPSSTSLPPAAVAAMSSGDYHANGDITLGGGSVVNPSNRISVYVDGDVFITSNITYAGSWGSGDIPMFRLIARGNIYISNSVTQLDGLYVAQPSSSGDDGVIFTCASGIDNVPSNSSLASACDAKLTVNGSFVAKQVRLMRSAGTLGQSSASEGPGSSSIAEVFNYGPAVWIPQPSGGQGSAEYDAINSLPPVL